MKSKKINKVKKEKEIKKDKKKSQDNELIEKNNSNGLSFKFLISLFSMSLLFIVVLCIGFLIHYRFDTKTVEDNKPGGNIKLVFTTEDSSINIPNSTPFVDSIGVLSIYNFDFSVETKLKDASSVEYELSVSVNDELNTIPKEDIKVYLEKENSGTYSKFFGPSLFRTLKKDSLLGSKKGDMVIAEVKKIKSGVDNYRLRVWQADTSASSGGVISVEVKLNGKAK